MIVLQIICIIFAIAIAITALYILVKWLSLPIDIKDYFEEQNNLIKDLTNEVKRLNKTISDSSKK